MANSKENCSPNRYTIGKKRSPVSRKSSPTSKKCSPFPKKSASPSKRKCSPPKKARGKLSLSLSKKRRFKETSNAELASLEKIRVPKNTEVSSRWALKNFTDWFNDYNERNPSSPCPDSILTPSATAEDLNKYLKIFILETRNQAGDKYPPKTIYSLLSGILRVMKAENSSYPNFLDKKNPAFQSFLIALDNLFKSLSAEGVGANAQRTENFSVEEEETLWTSGVLNVESPKGLLRATFFVCGKCFCLRGGQEHRNLAVSQFKRLHDPDRYVYHESSSKNRPGGIQHVKMDHKAVTIVANPAVKDRCPVFILDKYIAKLPAAVFEKDLFYCKPLSVIPKDDTSPWFSAVP